MKPILALFAVAIAATSMPALAYDDEMMGTMVNGRMPVRDERSDRVQDPAMDREEMIIDREKRQGRNIVTTNDPDSPLRKREPFDGPLPD